MALGPGEQPCESESRGTEGDTLINTDNREGAEPERKESTNQRERASE